MEPIAHISSLFPTKFGIPRQAGIVNTPARILFEPQYRNAEAVRGLEAIRRGTDTAPLSLQEWHASAI